MNKPLLPLLLPLFLLSMPQMFAQHGYEASWKAGLLGMRQNPAAIVSSVHRGELVLGAGNLTAQNNLFSSNEYDDFFPSRLVMNSVTNPGDLLFMTGVREGDFDPTGNASEWFAENRGYAQIMSLRFRIKTDPNARERGINRQAIAIRLERDELVQISGVNQTLVEGAAREFTDMAGTRITRDDWRIQVREWDALGINYGISIGRGKNRFHVGIGAKLLSAAGYLDLNVTGNQWEFINGNSVRIGADSVSLAYNPTLEDATNPNGRRRYPTFENSLGFSGEIGFTYQMYNYNREPVFEAGLALMDIGSLRFWNIEERNYSLPGRETTYDPNGDFRSINGVENTLSNLAAETSQLSDQGVRESLPLRLTGHAKVRLGDKGWGVQARGNLGQRWSSDGWNGQFIATLCREKRGLSWFIPLTFGPDVTSNLPADWSPTVGLFLSLGDVLVVGSNDLLSSVYRSATREGVSTAHLFATFKIPFGR
ncbi:MAG: hypothetical protein AAGI38_11550 [Bacteroidota bacterium]